LTQPDSIVRHADRATSTPGQMERRVSHAAVASSPALTALRALRVRMGGIIHRLARCVSCAGQEANRTPTIGAVKGAPKVHLIHLMDRCASCAQAAKYRPRAERRAKRLVRSQPLPLFLSLLWGSHLWHRLAFSAVCGVCAGAKRMLGCFPVLRTFLPYCVLKHMVDAKMKGIY